MRQSQKSLLILMASIAVLITLAVGNARVNSTSADKLSFSSNEKIVIDENLTDFSSLKASGAWQLEISQSDSWSVEINDLGDFNDKVSVYVSDGTLFLIQQSSGGWFNKIDSELSAKVTMPNLHDLEFSGAAEVILADFTGEQLNVKTSGAAELQANNGKYNMISIATAGASELDFKNIITNHASVNTKGASDIVLTMNGGELTGSIIGAGSINYFGTVSQESIDIVGAGDVTNRN